VFLGHLIEKLTTYHVFTIDDALVITQINRDESPAKVKQFLRSIASNKNAGELSQLLYDSIEEKLHYASPQGKGAPILCSVGVDYQIF
jgi:hypothetical protein